MSSIYDIKQAIRKIEETEPKISGMRETAGWLREWADGRKEDGVREARMNIEKISSSTVRGGGRNNEMFFSMPLDDDMAKRIAELLFEEAGRMEIALPKISLDKVRDDV